MPSKKINPKTTVKSTKNNDDDNEPMNDLAEEYKKKDPIRHVLDLPDTYIGSIENEDTVQYIMDDDFEDDEDEIIIEKKNPKFIKKEFVYNPGLKGIVEEILINAYDNINRINQKNSKIAKGKRKFKTVTYIKGWMDRELGQIVIENDGEGIDVAIHPTETKKNGDPLYIPEMIFSDLLTSGNYDKTGKITGGKNGYGAKLTNIYSLYYKVETVDRHRKLKYTQEFKNNMYIKCPPVIEKYTGDSFTRITFRPDLERFGIKRMDRLFESLIKKRFYDMYICANTKIDVYFNGIKLGLDTYNDYYNMYLPKNYMMNEDEEVDELTRGNLDEFNKSKIVFCQPNDRWTIAACPSPKLEFEQISFVNGIITYKGGTHVNYIVSQITSKMVELIKKKKKITVKEQFVKENLMIFVNSIIEDPKFDSQTKSYHTTPKTKFGSTCDVPDEFVKKLYDTGVVDTIIELNIMKAEQQKSRNDGNKRKKINVEKLSDAGWAGGKNASKTILILTEGDSAKTLAMNGRGVVEGGTKIIGVYPLKGKPINPRDTSAEKYNQNQELTDLKTILALKEGVEYKDVSSLRYGKIMFMTDQDHDGFHIKGLLMNILSRWPSLMKIDGFICCLLTPIVKAWKGKDKEKGLKFYTMPDFKKWMENTANSKSYKYKYYKGLGTSTPKEGKEYFRDLRIVNYKWDDNTEQMIENVFGKGTVYADKRKVWLSTYDENKVLDIKKNTVVYPDFFNYEFIHFSNSDNIRSIPNIIDGFKPSQRKIIYSCFKRNLVNEIRVAQLGGYVSEHSNYHHGEASLFGAITNLAQSFPGSNNINLLHPEGQFGTRLNNGKDAAQPRYIFTFIENITFKIFNKLDNPLLTYSEDDGIIAEPDTYYPIIPMALVNGSEGIGTGWASKMPSFNPLDIINNIRLFLDNKPIKSFTPYYRGFKGSITKIKDCSWLVKGVFESDSKNKTITITEIPFTTSIDDFEFMLSNMVVGSTANPVTNKKKGKGRVALHSKDRKKKYTEYLKSFDSESTDNTPKFILYFTEENFTNLLSGIDKNGLTKFETEFKMATTISCPNTLNFYNEHKKLVSFKSIESILEYFVKFRLTKYNERYNYLLEDLQIKANEISIKTRFISDIINEKIEIRNQRKQKVLERLEKLKYPKVHNVKKTGGKLRHIVLTEKQYNKLSEHEKQECNYDFLFSMDLLRLTTEKIKELEEERDQIMKELETLKEKTGKDLWLSDLDDLVKEYDIFIKDYCKYYDIDYKTFNKKGTPLSKKSDLSNLTRLKPKKKNFDKSGVRINRKTGKKEVIVDLN